MIYVFDIVVCVFFFEVGMDGCVFFLNDGFFVGDGFCGVYVVDELFDCGVVGMLVIFDMVGWLVIYWCRCR